jgi:hypothetical protein
LADRISRISELAVDSADVTVHTRNPQVSKTGVNDNFHIG